MVRLAGELESLDLLAVGMLADEARRRLHGNRVTFVRVARLPLRGPEGRAAAIPSSAGEIRIDGRLDDLDGATARVREVAAVAGGRPVSGFELADLVRHSQSKGIGEVALFRRLREAGLELIAEAQFDRLEEPLAACEAAAAAGLPIARVTLQDLPQQGALPTFADLRSIQDKLGTLRAFAPLPRSFSSSSPTTGYDDVKQVALARLLVENIPVIQVDWSLYGPKLAQVALTFGADDVDAVSPTEDSATAGWRRSSIEEVRRNIVAASFVPAERNGRFERLGT